ncbi:hypothetical protein FHX75_111312 [Micromonospora palomenae]|uniref:Uncharacterized protein n=1 Tax=Micromonospora palomenae TaxID=1461247 RepID=A0A561WWE2_9ACTN|nr:hypothetical protein FHX75_111312 [Micromonospora palomenae]
MPLFFSIVYASMTYCPKMSMHLSLRRPGGARPLQV